ncbi:MAG: putative Histidine kinase [Candidatus Saccharibacteria bacterium]|nr:putative Histidine kinase [Candidatus Saccharibacteria bacterium]
MFQSATLKLTGWYLAIIICISLIFSYLIYVLSVNEVEVRLENLQSGLTQAIGVLPIGESAIKGQLSEAGVRIIVSLAYMNAVVIVGGGVGSYLLARRTMRPIEEMHDAQSRFTSDASHELRTPLATMRTELEVSLRDEKITKAELREVLHSNLEEVEKLSHLSEMLLTLSRLEYHKLAKSRLNLRELTEEVVRHINSKKRPITIEGPDKVSVYGNEAAISELITILIDNALKYSPEGSPIIIRLHERLLQSTFRITNQGPGINEKMLPYIFERFFRADTSRTKSSEQGLGLGLAIAKKIAELHDGTISAASKPGEQTTFIVGLPTNKDFSPIPHR